MLIRTFLVADTAFIAPGTPSFEQLLAVFPQREGDGAMRDSLDGLLRRSHLQSAYYRSVIGPLVGVFAPHMAAAGGEAHHLVRPVLVTVTSLFVDRCLRVVHRLRQLRGREVAAVAVEPVADIQWLSQIAQTWRLNQDLIQRIMAALGYERVEVLDRDGYPEYPNEHVQPNLLFAPPRRGLAGLPIQARNRTIQFLKGWPNSRVRTHSFGMGVNTYYFGSRGFWGPFGLFNELPSLQLLSAGPDEELRATLRLGTAAALRPATQQLLQQLAPELSETELTALAATHAEVFVEWFPAGFLEGLAANLEPAIRMSGKRVTALVSDSLATDQGYLHCVAARLAGQMVVGVNHTAGHYGYIEDMSLAGQFEYPLCDKMVTWGWSRIDEHLPQCETVPMPSPKLSSRPLAGTSRSGASVDVLFLSNLIHRFPHASTCGQARVDFIDDIFRSQLALVTAFSRAGLSLAHKPYGMKFVDLYSDHFRALEHAGGSGYRLVTSRHKGMTRELIGQHRILLWDQLGSGALECFTAGIPAIVYWPRIYSRELTWTRPLLAELERTGVVLPDAQATADQVRSYLADPGAWMGELNRQRAIAEFCHAFARTDANWSQQWKKWIRSLSERERATGDRS